MTEVLRFLVVLLCFSAPQDSTYRALDRVVKGGVGHPELILFFKDRLPRLRSHGARHRCTINLRYSARSICVILDGTLVPALLQQPVVCFDVFEVFL